LRNGNTATKRNAQLAKHAFILLISPQAGKPNRQAGALLVEFMRKNAYLTDLLLKIKLKGIKVVQEKPAEELELM
jgi:hypothetical protein